MVAISAICSRCPLVALQLKMRFTTDLTQGKGLCPLLLYQIDTLAITQGKDNRHFHTNQIIMDWVINSRNFHWLSYDYSHQIILVSTRVFTWTSLQGGIVAIAALILLLVDLSLDASTIDLNTTSVMVVAQYRSVSTVLL